LKSEKKTAYPMMPVSQWWKLREKFKQSIPGLVTDRYIASALGMKVESARANVLPALRQTGIIDDDGKPTELARQWRDDKQYPKTCEAIYRKVYPSELRDACPDPTKDREAAERWFASKTGAGKVAVRKMTTFYALLCNADPAFARVRGSTRKKHVAPTKKKLPGERGATPKPATVPALEPDSRQDPRTQPDIRINLQIHISADASADQIDEIFASIARHIYDKTIKS